MAEHRFDRKPDEAMIKVPLHAIAHGRAGDKGNRSNISLFPYKEQAFPTLREQVTEARVRGLFASRGVTRVTRYELPRLPAFNFVIDDALEGGVNASLNLDTHGKSLSFLLLGLEIKLRPDEYEAWRGDKPDQR